MLERLSRPGVRCRYVMQIAALRSTSRRLCSIDVVSGRRGRRPLPYSARRAAASCVVQFASEVPLSGSGMRGQQQRVFVIAATMVSPLDSPLLRGVKGTPLPALPHLPFPGLLRDDPPMARLRRKRVCFFCHRQRSPAFPLRISFPYFFGRPKKWGRRRHEAPKANA